MGYQVVKSWLIQCVQDKRLSGSFVSDEYQVFWLKSEIRINYFFEGKVNGQVTVTHETLIDVIESNKNVHNSTKATLDYMFDIIGSKVKAGGNFRLRFKSHNNFTFIPIA